MRKRSQRGAAMIEMTLVGIPIIFIVISIFEISRGMWMYHTLAYSVKEGARYAATHGYNCNSAPPAVNNDCKLSIAQIAARVRFAGVGLDPATTRLTFCAPAPISGLCAGGSTSCTINACASITTTFFPPPDGVNNRVGANIEMDIITPFRSALAMFWPGSRPVSFGVVNLGASSTVEIQF